MKMKVSIAFFGNMYDYLAKTIKIFKKKVLNLFIRQVNESIGILSK